MDGIDDFLFLFAHSDALRPVYVALTLLAVLAGVLLSLKRPFFNVAAAKSSRMKWTHLAVATFLIAMAFTTLQYTKVLQFSESPRCDSEEDKVLYLPLWVDKNLEPYLEATYSTIEVHAAILPSKLLCLDLDGPKQLQSDCTFS
jgi:hypothetical protein